MDRIIFILGAPRSGTTLFLGMLVNKQTHIGGVFRESQFYTDIFTKVYSLKMYLENEFYLNLLDKNDVEQLFRQSSNHIEFFKKSIEFYLHKNNKNYFVEKSPVHTLYFENILRDFDNPRIILIMRNPAAVIYRFYSTHYNYSMRTFL